MENQRYHVTFNQRCKLAPYPRKIIGTLAAAQNAAGKKPATTLLDKKFRIETGSRINTMIFEIGPDDWDYKRLTWADVAEVLGDDGLPKFFNQRQLWHCVYFDVMHSTRGKLGEGAVRKWYMLESVAGAERVDFSRT